MIAIAQSWSIYFFVSVMKKANRVSRLMKVIALQHTILAHNNALWRQHQTFQSCITSCAFSMLIQHANIEEASCMEGS
jgi:hypothetical protein